MNDAQRQLVDWHLDGDLDGGETAQLQALLASDPTAITHLAERAALVADLRRSLHRRALQCAALAEVGPVVPFPAHRRWVAWTWAAAAAVALLAAGAWFIFRPEVQLLRGAGPRFAEASPNVTRGEWVGRSFQLTAGLVELRFRRADASVVIEAPAKFRIEDAKTLRVESGRVTAHVRDGRQGLRVLTPHTDVLDLGTRFAVDVVAGRRSEVHVFEGKVETSDAGAKPSRALVANEALRFATAVAPETRPVRSGSFVQPEEVAALGAALRSGQVARAEAAERKLRTDPALLAFFDFAPAADGAHLASGEAVRGARWVQGRFPGRHALEFLEADDHVRFESPQRGSQVTLMTWVRLDRTPGGASSIFHTDDWKTPGQLHWTLHDRGGMLFSMFAQAFPPEPDRPRGWPRSVLPLTNNLGGWMHLALVYDAAAREVRFYSNGRPDGGRQVLHDLPAVLGPAQIGNWNVKDWQDRNPLFNRHDRRLSGRMDEFVMLGRAFSPDEIAAYFRSTNPYQ